MGVKKQLSLKDAYLVAGRILMVYLFLVPPRTLIVRGGSNSNGLILKKDYTSAPSDSLIFRHVLLWIMEGKIHM